MTNEPAPKGANTPQKVTVADVFRKLYEIDKDNTWAGKNAEQLVELVTLKKDDVSYGRRTIEQWKKDNRYVPTWGYVLSTLVSLVLFLLVRGSWRWPFAIIFLVCFYLLCFRDGTNSGASQGYELGYRDAVYKTLGVPEEDARQMRHKATQMESDRRVVRALNKRS